MKNFKKLTAVLCAVLLLVSLFSLSALADGESGSSDLNPETIDIFGNPNSVESEAEVPEIELDAIELESVEPDLGSPTIEPDTIETKSVEPDLGSPNIEPDTIETESAEPDLGSADIEPDTGSDIVAAAEPEASTGLSTTAIVWIIVGAIVLVALIVLGIKFRANIAKFFRTYKSECKKIAWLSWEQTKKSTLVVLAVLLVCAIVICVVDFGLSKAFVAFLGIFTEAA